MLTELFDSRFDDMQKGVWSRLWAQSLEHITAIDKRSRWTEIRIGTSQGRQQKARLGTVPAMRAHAAQNTPPIDQNQVVTLLVFMTKQVCCTGFIVIR